MELGTFQLRYADDGEPVRVGPNRHPVSTLHMQTARGRALELSLFTERAIVIHGAGRDRLIVNPDGTTERPAGTKPSDERSDHKADGPCFCPACRADRRTRRSSNRRTPSSSSLSSDQRMDTDAEAGKMELSNQLPTEDHMPESPSPTLDSFITRMTVNIELPREARAFSKCRIDHDEFRRIAREVFGLERPVTLRRSNARTRYGSHTSYPTKHNVMVSRACATVRSAAATLAHELWHCVQAESRPWQEYVTEHRRESASYSYRNLPREVEAREAEELFWQDLLPCIIVPD